MSSSWILVIAALIAAAGMAFVVERLLTLRAGLLKAAAEAPSVDTSELGLSETQPTIVHFTAPWCGPCATVRRVVDQVCADLPRVSHMEWDIVANPDIAHKLSVLSLPTTFVFDAEGRQHYRSSGVPTTDELRSALEPLLA